MAFKDFVAEILGIKSYEDKYEKTKQTLENLQRAHETILAANDILARQIIDLEDKIEVLKANPEKYVWERCRDFARTHTEDMEHRAFANGRQQGYVRQRQSENRSYYHEDGGRKMNRQSIAKLFGVETYRDALHEMSLENDSLASQVAKLKIRCENLADEVEYYKNNEDVKELADKYIKMIQIYQDSATRCEAMIEDMEDRLKRMYNKGFAEGRQSAYSELGIWRLDALEAGNRLVMDQKGDVYELLELEDVKPEDTGMVEDDGIVIDDLVDVGA